MTDFTKVSDEKSFNEDVSLWDVSKATNLERIFREAGSKYTGLEQTRGAWLDRAASQVRRVPAVNHLMQSAGTGAFTEYAHIEETVSPAVLDTVTSWILGLRDFSLCSTVPKSQRLLSPGVTVENGRFFEPF